MLSFSEIVASEEVASIFERGLADRKSLTSTERIRFDFLFSRIMADAANLYADHLDGFESAGMVNQLIFSLVPMLRTPGGLQYWSAWKATFDSAFRDKIDETLGGLSATSSRSPAV